LNFEFTESSGFEQYRAAERRDHRRVRVASLEDLLGFRHASEDTLVHKSKKDFWALRQAEDGGYFIERVFDESKG
jgi:hypothetical protein